MTAKTKIVATEKIKKLVLSYSGGLDTSVMLRWIKDHFGCEVVAYCAEVGQGDETEGLEEKALKTGASKLYIERNLRATSYFQSCARMLFTKATTCSAPRSRGR